MSRGRVWACALAYDYLVIALGPHVAYGEVPGVGPEPVGHTVSICTLEHAMEARRAWAALLENPGPAIVGATQKAGCFGAAYEFSSMSTMGCARRARVTGYR